MAKMHHLLLSPMGEGSQHQERNLGLRICQSPLPLTALMPFKRKLQRRGSPPPHPFPSPHTICREYGGRILHPHHRAHKSRKKKLFEMSCIKRRDGGEKGWGSRGSPTLHSDSTSPFIILSINRDQSQQELI